MERLTDPCWKNLDPWECCGQDKFCNRDCHEAGGCTNGCIVPKLYVRLAGHEDTCLEPWQADAAKSIVEMAFEDKPERAERIRELMKADKAGILVFPEKYPEIWALFYFCVESGIKCTMERLYDGYAVRFPNGGDFAQHYGTYGGTEGSVEPAIGDDEFDYSAVGLNLAKTLVEKHKSNLQKNAEAMKDG